MKSIEIVINLKLVKICDKKRVKRATNKIKDSYTIGSMRKQLKHTLPPKEHFDSLRVVPLELTMKFYKYMTMEELYNVDYVVGYASKPFDDALISNDL